MNISVGLGMLAGERCLHSVFVYRPRDLVPYRDRDRHLPLFSVARCQHFSTRKGDRGGYTWTELPPLRCVASCEPWPAARGIRGSVINFLEAASTGDIMAAALLGAAKAARGAGARRRVPELLRQAARVDFLRPYCAPVVQRRDGTSAPVDKLRGFIVRRPATVFLFWAPNSPRLDAPRGVCSDRVRRSTSATRSPTAHRPSANSTTSRSMRSTSRSS